jgi:LysM repeat protein
MFQPANKLENAMTKRIFQVVVVIAILVASFASVGGASAWGCASYITVQWGDTLSGIAAQCGTTMAAIQAANPGLGAWVYAGQVLCIPTGYASSPVSYPSYPTSGGTYVVQLGDTLGKISARTGVSVASLLALNPQIWNPSLIYVGQAINLPGSVSVPSYPPQTQTDYDDDVPFPDAYSSVKIAYLHGLYVRSSPGGPIIASAMNKTTWYYRQSSVFTDSKWRVWAEVRLYPPVDGYATGWMLVKDQFGATFTNPPIDD